MTEASQLTHWSAYWQAGAKHSLPQDFEGNYDRDVSDFWQAQFSRVPSGGQILDVCTGTGAIALLAARWGVDHEVTITAIDGADIDVAALPQIWPDEASLLEKIEFIFSTPLEQLAVDRFSRRFDLITSQYGLEYCDLSAVAPTVVSALKPGGRLALVTHGVDSDMAMTMQREQADYQTLTDSGYFKVLASWSKQQIAANDLVDRLTKINQTLAERFQATQSQLLAQVLQTNRVILSQPVGQVVAQHGQARAYLEQLQAASQRLEDMLRVTALVNQGDDWVSPLTDLGLVLTTQEPLRVDDQHLAGYIWVFDRPA